MIIFLHFHKAAGSTIVQILKRKKKFFEPNKNGNPAYKISYNKSVTIDYWSRNKEDINVWINKQRCIGVEVMCLEWNFFNPHNFISDNISYIVCFRDPLKRFYSCLNFESIRKTKSYLSPFEFQKMVFRDEGFIVSYNKDNYYTRMLCGLGNKPYLKIEESHLDYAKKVLDRFKIILILENKKSFRLLSKIGIRNINIPRTMTTKYYIKKHDLFDKDFIKRNKFDYELYNYAVKLSNEQMS
tara:strand:- start:403 stop:1125 length:723 start_codon:yes stop_codon:yes gene_type:complete